MTDVRYTTPECKFFFDGNHLVTNGAKMKKMSASNIGAVLGLNPFGKTQFQMACDLLGIAKKEFKSDATNAGNYLEEPLIDFINEQMPEVGLFAKAKDVFPGHVVDENGKALRYGERISDFESDYFSGNIDCMLYAADGNQYIVDVKTFNEDNIVNWENGAPENYALQVMLYNHFICHQDKGYFIACKLTKYEQAHPETVKFEMMHRDGDKVVGNVMLVEMPIDQKQFEMRMNKCIEWYDTYIKNCVTPEYELPLDNAILEHLRTICLDVNDIVKYADELEATEQELAVKESDLEDLRKHRDALRDRIKDFMIHNDLAKIPTTSKKFEATVSKSIRKSVSETMLRNAGIDPTPFIVTMTVNTFTLKPVKEEKKNTEE